MVLAFFKAMRQHLAESQPSPSRRFLADIRAGYQRSMNQKHYKQTDSLPFKNYKC
jgi:hypothetical protein